MPLHPRRPKQPKIAVNLVAEHFEPPAPLKTAVLFLVFNRLSVTRQVFEAIRKVQPPRLYIAADGPRAEHPEDARRCAEVRKIATQIDWPCELKTLFRDENLGCRRAVSGALDWFFASEELGIILEDDCLPGRSWFPFAEEMLARYRDDERVMCISANHFHGDMHRPEHSYFFSIYNHCWGWASWRRVWRYYDHEMRHWPDLRSTNWLLHVGYGDAAFKVHWTRVFDMAYEGLRVDSWAYRWTFSCWAQNGLTIIPARNLVTNIGFGPDATHTGLVNKALELPQEELTFPLNHPQTMVRDVDADRWTSINVFGITFPGLIKQTLRRLPIVGESLAAVKRMSACLYR